MSTLSSYLLQMCCWLAAFWLTYQLVLKKETYFKLNRWFLNIGLVAALVMPFFPIQYNVTVLSQSISTISEFTTTNVVNSHENTREIDYWLMLYLMGTLFYILRFIIQHYKLHRIRKVSKQTIIDSIKVYTITKETTPFSFFNKIYVGENIKSQTELTTVVAHEKVHIHERHWADLLLLEVVRTFQWFNPLMQLYRKAMMQNHEFLADTGTIKFGVSAHTYKAILANQMLGIPVVRFANSFTIHNSSNRLKMMNKHKSNPINRFKFLLILPLISIILVGFAKPKSISETNINAVVSDNAITVKGKVLDENGEKLQGASIVISHTRKGAMSNKNGEFVLEGVKPNETITVSFVGYETIVSPVKKEMTFNMQRNVVLIDVRQEKVAPPPPPPPPASALEFRSKDGKTPLIVIDGEIYKSDIMQIDQETIEKMEVLKDEAAIALYGDKGKDGVILITTKKMSNTKRNSDDEVFIIVEDMPKYPGGESAMKHYIQTEASKLNLKGNVYVNFTIDNNGAVKNVKTVKSSSETLNESAEKIIKGMPNWTPGKQRGKPVNVDFTVNIEF